MSLLSGPAGLLGIGDSHGDYYKNGSLNNTGTQSLQEMLAAARGAKVSGAGQSLAGGGSLADALKGLSGDESNALGASGIYGNMVASDQTRNDPLMSGLLGKGGSLEDARNSEKQLSSQGFQLQPQDVEAYGQASGNIARQFGQSEQSLASALANHGMAAGGSGGAMAQFSGLQGNKNEQLGQMQMQIANDRMQNTMTRLKQTRDYEAQLGGLGANVEQNKFTNNLNADKNVQNQANDVSNAQRADYGAVEGAKQASMASQQGAEKQNLGDALSSGLYQGVEAGAGAGAAGVMGGKTNKKGAQPTIAGDPSNGKASLATAMLA